MSSAVTCDDFKKIVRAGAERAHFGNAGLTHAINDTFQLDARVGHAVTREKRGLNHFFGPEIARR